MLGRVGRGGMRLVETDGGAAVNPPVGRTCGRRRSTAAWVVPVVPDDSNRCRSNHFVRDAPGSRPGPRRPAACGRTVRVSVAARSRLEPARGRPRGAAARPCQGWIPCRAAGKPPGYLPWSAGRRRCTTGISRTPLPSRPTRPNPADVRVTEPHRSGQAGARVRGGRHPDYELRIRQCRQPLVLTPAFGGRELERRAP